MKPSEKILPFIFYYIKRHRWKLFFICMCEIIAASLTPVTSYGIKNVIDSLSSSDFNGFASISEPFWVLIGFMSISLIADRLGGITNVYTMPILRQQAKQDLFNHVSKHSHEYFLNNFSGSIAHKVNEITKALSDVVNMSIFLLIHYSASLLISIYFLMITNSTIGFIFVAWVTLYLGIAKALGKRCKQLSQVAAKSSSEVSGQIVDSVTNIFALHSFARRDYEEQRLQAKLEDEKNKHRKFAHLVHSIRTVFAVTTIIAFIAMTYICVELISTKEMTIGDFVLIFTISLASFAHLKMITFRFMDIFERFGVLQDGISILNVPNEIQDQENAEEINVNQGLIEFKDVSFSYEKTGTVFDKLNLSIKPGEKVGLVGFSGSGKSTFMNLILRNFEIDRGEILIDDQNITKVTQDSLRDQISLVPQDPILFHRTLDENIAYGNPNADEKEILTASKKAHAHEFIMDLPKQYDSVAGERGVKLSGGQRQRIAIARAILKDAPILLMDEATSSLDSVTEKNIQDGLVHVMENRTAIVIAHRLSTISHMDRIIVFNKGQIVEDGSHDDLLKKNGHYRKMWDMQAGGFLPDSEED